LPDEDAIEGPGFGYVGVGVTYLHELPDTLLVQAIATIPCGGEDAIYLYHFDRDARQRWIDDQPLPRYGEAKTELAPPDPQGQRLLLVHRMTQQCSSAWMETAYAVYRVPFVPGPPDKLLAVEHDFWWNDQYPVFALKPEELTVEFLAESVDGGVHNRTYIQRHGFTDGARRLDPVALQPQDFVEEWLTRPWAEMLSRSKPETENWHSKLHADFVGGEYSQAVPCAEAPNLWLIGLNIDFIGEKELQKPVRSFFVVRDLGNYHYQMESVSDTRPKQCPKLNGSVPLDKHPWLSRDELRALPRQ
jgi:hypothetical protein